MDQTNWIAVIVVAIFAVSIFHGYRKGFFRLCVSFTVTILTVILVVILTPYAGDAIVRWTEIDEVIRENMHGSACAGRDCRSRNGIASGADQYD